MCRMWRKLGISKNLSKKIRANGVTKRPFCGIIVLYMLTHFIQEKRDAMTSYEIRKRAARRRRYFVLLLLVIIVLIFAVSRIVSRARTPDAVATMESTAITETAEVIEDTTEGLTRPTHPDPEAPTEEAAETKPEFDPVETSVQRSENGTLFTPRLHVYLRINHEQKIPLSLKGGVAGRCRVDDEQCGCCRCAARRHRDGARPRHLHGDGKLSGGDAGDPGDRPRAEGRGRVHVH